MKKSQFPSIRFKEFTNAWEQGNCQKNLIPLKIELKIVTIMNLVSFLVRLIKVLLDQNRIMMMIEVVS
ncbi:hypothetical protein HYE44_00990 [Mycoplasmopsis bovis]|nr:hypothetical protein HYE44_00990 [Mycoplasmopsis bovis]